MYKLIGNLGKRLLPQDPFFRLLAINGLTGLGISGLVLGGIFYSNIGNLTVLVQGDESPVVPVLMLAAGLVITLGSVVVGSAIMLLGASGGNGKPGPKLPELFSLEPAPVPVPMRAQSARRSRISSL
ncbi:hypothetical protein [Roseibium sp.]|uniref:hypothetical protein n=1 Tax=Roseibium sp. TaxID=1936156 RepID=UPI003B5241AE